jgi:hypothetical protein
MKCPRCQQDNLPGSNFCLGCGTRLGATCGACGKDLPAGSRFCNKCGSPVSGDSPGQLRLASPESYTPKHLAEKILNSKAAIEGERKQVTVLFCDVANSTTLAERLGAEAMHALLNRFFELALAGIHQYEGTVNQFLGDGFMALFGAPVPGPLARRHNPILATALLLSRREPCRLIPNSVCSKCRESSRFRSSWTSVEIPGGGPPSGSSATDWT